jgi:hypothetical protein
MIDPATPAASAPWLTMLGGAGALTCTDEACLATSTPHSTSTEPETR